MSKTEYTGDGEETTVLSYEMQQRVQALRAARRILERHTAYPNGGIYSMPTIEPGDTIDLHSLASWIITGKDPWAAPPRDDGMPAWAIEELLDRLRDRGWIHDEPKGEDVADGPITDEDRAHVEDAARGYAQMMEHKAAEAIANSARTPPPIVAPEPEQAAPTGNHFLARLREQAESYEHATARTEDCPACSGSGVSHAGVQCPSCEGFGRRNAARDATDPDSVHVANYAAYQEAPLNWRQPDPITPAERERMAEAAAQWKARLDERLPGPITDPQPDGWTETLSMRKAADVEKDDVPIPFIQTEAGRAAVKQAYDEFGVIQDGDF